MGAENMPTGQEVLNALAVDKKIDTQDWKLLREAMGGRLDGKNEWRKKTADKIDHLPIEAQKAIERWQKARGETVESSSMAKSELATEVTPKQAKASLVSDAARKRFAGVNKNTPTPERETSYETELFKEFLVRKELTKKVAESRLTNDFMNILEVKLNNLLNDKNNLSLSVKEFDDKCTAARKETMARMKDYFAENNVLPNSPSKMAEISRLQPETREVMIKVAEYLESKDCKMRVTSGDRPTGSHKNGVSFDFYPEGKIRGAFTPDRAEFKKITDFMLALQKEFGPAMTVYFEVKPNKYNPWTGMKIATSTFDTTTGPHIHVTVKPKNIPEGRDFSFFLAEAMENASSVVSNDRIQLAAKPKTKKLEDENNDFTKQAEKTPQKPKTPTSKKIEVQPTTAEKLVKKPEVVTSVEKITAEELNRKISNMIGETVAVKIDGLKFIHTSPKMKGQETVLYAGEGHKVTIIGMPRKNENGVLMLPVTFASADTKGKPAEGEVSVAKIFRNGLVQPNLALAPQPRKPVFAEPKNSETVDDPREASVIVPSSELLSSVEPGNVIEVSQETALNLYQFDGSVLENLPGGSPIRLTCLGEARNGFLPVSCNSKKCWVDPQEFQSPQVKILAA